LSPPNRHLITGLKICAFLIFIGRAYQYLFFDAPFRALLWDQSLLHNIVEGVFNTPWKDYVTNLSVDQWIQRSIKINGVLFGIAAFASLLINKRNVKLLRPIIYTGGIFLIILSFLTMKDMFFHSAQFFEHALQIGIPFLLVFAIAEKFNFNKLIFSLKILIAITFVSHGLYALGYYPIPGYFIDMTIGSLNVTEDTAVGILKFAGIMDMILAIFIFVPKVAKYFLIYAMLWGLLTAMARIVSFFNWESIASSIHQTLFLVIYRLPHGLAPLLILITGYNLIKNKNNIASNTINLES